MKDIPHGIQGNPLILATNNIFANGKSVILSSNAKESDSSHKKLKQTILCPRSELLKMTSKSKV